MVQGAGGIPGPGRLRLRLQAELNRRGVSQCLWAVPLGGKPCRVSVLALARIEGIWQLACPPMAGVVGRNGIAPLGMKREGDGRSPGGLFPIGQAFGTEIQSDLRWPYRVMTEEDIWIDDPAAPDYNRLTTRAATRAQSFEVMRRPDGLYRLGLVVEYNTEQVVPGLGSAIFVHIWRGPLQGTSGCLALSPENMAWLLRWLTPAAQPVILFQPLQGQAF